MGFGIQRVSMPTDDESVQTLGFQFETIRPNIRWEHAFILSTGGATLATPLLLNGGLDMSQTAYLILIFPLLYIALIAVFSYF